MGYDAYVMCDCYQKGKTNKPPYEQYVKLDKDGLNLSLPNKIYKKNEDKYHRM